MSLLQIWFININSISLEFKIIKPISYLLKQLEKTEQYITQIENNDDCMICLTKEQYMCKLECNHIYCIKYLNII